MVRKGGLPPLCAAQDGCVLEVQPLREDFHMLAFDVILTILIQ